ncbi:MAG: DUF2298 domain-containing protein [Lachnospiraceae bacterium]|nr:DUF2298 domain-containing protein [Lachnospiraceae bacterium]
MEIILYWYLAMLAEGLACMPLAYFIFRRFTDRGWMFAKTTGLVLTAWLLWLCNCTHIMPFMKDRAYAACVIVATANYCPLLIAAVLRLMPGTSKRRNAEPPSAASGPLIRTFIVIAAEEALFFLIFASAVYIIGFRPEAYDTEKFMDYGFMTSMMRSLYMPFADPWYAGSAVNYYYGGQYVAAFLTKLTGVTAGEGYNLMRGLITSFSFVLPFSLVRQMLSDRMKLFAAGEKGSISRTTAFEIGDAGNKSAASVLLFDGLPLLGGILAGIGTAFSGNFHYVIYGLIKPAAARLTGVSSFYWFPDSTRFIGYDPDIPDKTIHEFPAYSSVLGDLHAHYINIIFVLTVTAIVYGWARKHDSRKNASRSYACPEVLLTGFMTGIFRWTNFWDFPIYFVVCGSVFFFVMLRTYGKNLRRFPADILILAAVMFITGYAGAYPFTVSFDQISSEIALTHSHTSLYQLAVLWGVPALCLLIFAVVLLAEWFSRMFSKDMPENAAAPRPGRTALPDLTALLFGLCAAGLVFLPEVIYVKDIYGDSHYRANTMFKLTYQAFILFAISTAYISVRFIMSYAAGKCSVRAAGPSGPFAPPEAKKQAASFEPENDLDRAPAAGRRAALFGICMSVMVAVTGTYTVTAVRSWFGDVTDPSNRISTDASVFISEYYPEDLEAVCWINSHISGQPVILEAPGDSYSDSCRISVATGLPTVVGWYVHEWLWRNDPDSVYMRKTDCDAIYGAKDAADAGALLEKYGVNYIYIGGLEREIYPDMDEKLLRGLGKVVFEDGDGTCFIELTQG